MLTSNLHNVIYVVKDMTKFYVRYAVHRDRAQGICMYTVYDLSWHAAIFAFQGHEIHHNVTAGIILSDHSLVLQGVTRHTAGDYTCLAANTEGKGTSNPVTLRVMCE